MADVFDTITKFINSPPGQLAAGGVLAGIVWKFFERVESVLNKSTKLEIAVWLLGVKVGQKLEPWPSTFRKLFDVALGTEDFSWRATVRSGYNSLLALILSLGISQTLAPSQYKGIWTAFGKDTSARLTAFALVVLYYWGIANQVALLKTRLILKWTKQSSSSRKLGLALVLDFLLTSSVGILSALGLFWSGLVNLELVRSLGYARPFQSYQSIVACVFRTPAAAVFVYPPFVFSSIWLWLYAGSGFLLKAARRFDIGFDWFNRHFDIEKKPLQSIGLVAGALVAVVYWAAVVIGHFV
jgi:hypothetical protein